MTPPAPERERLATIEADYRNLLRRVDGHHATLYGTQGGGGLNGDVQMLAAEFRHHVQEEASSSDRMATVIVGEDGQGGLVADVRALKDERDRWKWWARALGGLLLVALGDAVRRLVQWLAER